MFKIKISRKLYLHTLGSEISTTICIGLIVLGKITLYTIIPTTLCDHFFLLLKIKCPRTLHKISTSTMILIKWQENASPSSSISSFK